MVYFFHGEPVSEDTVNYEYFVNRNSLVSRINLYVCSFTSVM